MRNILLVAALVLPLTAFAQGDCVDASNFLKAAAVARDAGISEKESSEIMNQSIGKEDLQLYRQLNHLAYTAKRGTPEQLHRDFLLTCERSLRDELQRMR